MPNYRNLLVRAAPGLHEAILEEVQKRVPEGSSILDWGAGQGALTQRLVDHGFKVLAADLNDEFAAEGAAFYTVNFDETSSVQNFLDEFSENFDLVIGAEVIEHVENPWEYLRQMISLAKIGGWLVVSTPNPSSWHSRLKFLMTGTYDEFNSHAQEGHINPITPWEIKMIMERLGLTQITIIPAGKIYSESSYKGMSGLYRYFLELMTYTLRPFQSGLIDGYCFITICRKI